MLSKFVPRRLMSETDNSGPAWVFQRSDPMGGASGEAFVNALEATGMPPAHVLARESIQNAVDEPAEGGEKVAVTFRLVRLSGDAKQTFVRAAKLSSILARRADLSLPSLGWFDQSASPETPLGLVFVDDFHTAGLDGDPHDPMSRFHGLLLSVGDAGKAHSGHHTGGSYGFGKAAFSSNSEIRTIFAYSRYRDADSTPRTRLFGCGYFRSHEFESVRYNGRAWFGRSREPTPTAGQIVDPLYDAEADALASQLGFGLRDSDEIGTSILIVDSGIEAEELKEGVEEWWWPRIIDNELDVEVISPSGDHLIPRPKTRADLRPFIEAYDIANGTNPNPVPHREYKREFNRLTGNIELGTCALKVLDAVPEDEESSVGEDRVDAVALIRGPGMVVAYYRHWQPGTPLLVGVFKAAEQIDTTLKLSEDPAHHRWDRTSGRLREDTQRKIVQAVLERITSTVRGFRKEASPPPPPRTRRLSALERELANILVGRGPKEPPRYHPTAPVHLTYVRNPEAVPTNDGRLRVQAELQIRLKDDADQQTAKLKLKLKCVVLEDNAEGDRIEYDLQSDTTEFTKDETDLDLYFFEVDQDQPAKFSVVTEPYDAMWSVRFTPEIEPVAATVGAAE